MRGSSVSHFADFALALILPHQLPLPLPQLPPSGTQFSPGGSGAAPSLPGGQEAQRPLHRQQVGSQHGQATQICSPVTTAATSTSISTAQSVMLADL